MESDHYWKAVKLGHLESAGGYLASIPFVDFAIISGSIAMGKPHAESDIDLILGCRKGRIWTARFFAILILEIGGVRRRAGDSKQDSSNRICLNHFVTPPAYRLQPPYNQYWIDLYQKLIPFAGNEAAINAFFNANADWAGKRDIPPVRSLETKVKTNLEGMLSGSFGSKIEAFLKKIQLKKIQKNSVDPNKKPRLRFDDEELEFHPDTLRIEEYIGRLGAKN